MAPPVHPARTLCAAPFLLIGALLVGALLAGALHAAPTVHAYRIDPVATRVHARVGFFGLASKTAQFPEVSGTVALRPDNPEAVAMEILLDASQLTAGDGVTMARLKGPAFFDVERWPTVRFSGNRLVMHTPVTGDVVGTLTARGVTRPATLAVTFASPPARETGTHPVTLTARTIIDRRDFGMTAYRFIVGRQVTISIQARLQPAVLP